MTTQNNSHGGKAGAKAQAQAKAQANTLETMERILWLRQQEARTKRRLQALTTEQAQITMQQQALKNKQGKLQACKTQHQMDLELLQRESFMLKQRATDISPEQLQQALQTIATKNPTLLE